MLSCFLIGCTGNEKKSNLEKEEKKEQEEKIIVDETFTDEFGYIVDNNVFDYSNRFETTFEWMDGVKMPFEKINNSNVRCKSMYEYGYGEKMLNMEDFSEEELAEYIESFKREGYTVKFVPSSESNVYSRDVYYIYKDGIMIRFFMFEENVGNQSKNCMDICVYTGNVSNQRKVTIEDARNIIDKQKIFDENQYFEDYILVEVQNDTVSENGYYEYIAIAPTSYDPFNWNTYPYYIMTDGENINFYGHVGCCYSHPSNANIVMEEEQKTLVVTYTVASTNDSSTFFSYIDKYSLKDNKYVMEESYISDGDTIVSGMVENGEMVYYKMKWDEMAPANKGRKNAWIADEEVQLFELEAMEIYK